MSRKGGASARTGIVRLALVIVVLASILGGPAHAGRARRQSIVLSDFAPIEQSGTQLVLGDRIYDWDGGFLPEVYTRGSVLAGPMVLRLSIGGQRFALVPNAVDVVSSNPHDVTIQAVGEPYPGLHVLVTTRVEFDGVAMVTVVLSPEVPIDVDGLDFEVDVRANAATRMLKFQTSDIRVQKRDQPIQPSYAGPFLNAIGLADGERSFWWFADDAVGWIWNGSTVSEVTPIASDRIRIRKRLIGARHRVSAPMTMRMNFLATPVRELGSSWRRERFTAGVSTAEGTVGRIQGWWSTAFAHTALPFTEPPLSVLQQIPAGDSANYPGLETNRFYLERNLGKGIFSLPYFSAHCLSEIDPMLAARRAQWEVDPPFVVMSVDPSYPTAFEKPVLSHRSLAYGDYVLDRLALEIDKLGMPGIYLDHAPIMDSKNPNHAWVDSNGRTQPATDILGMRSFLKGIRTLFQLKGQPGYLFVHASNSELIPAYTFATGIADGEHFRHRLVNVDYIGSIPLDQTRIQHAPGQYGVRNVWIPQFEKWKASDPSWLGSAAERRAYRNFMTLVLLHDAEFWPVYIPQNERLGILSALDGFGVSGATFHGYWSAAPYATTSRSQAAVSLYRRAEKVLLVVGNLATSAQTVDVRVSLAAAGLPAGATARLVPDGTALPFASGRLDVSIPARDFALIEVQ
jgi:hypothetical protein